MYPYKLYLRFLISKLRSPEKVNTRLSSLGLPRILNATYQDIFNDLLNTTVPTEVLMYLNNDTDTILNRDAFELWGSYLQIGVLWKHEWNHDKTVESALRTFEDIEIRTGMTMLLLKKFETKEISDLILNRYDWRIDETAVDMFRQIFFDITVMNREHWRMLLPELDSNWKRQLWMAAKRDADHIRYLFGKQPSLSFGDVLGDIMATSYYQFKEATKDKKTVANERTVREWAKLAMSAGEKKERFSMGDILDFQKELDIALEFDDTDFPTIDEI